jgi:hypothetical protein
MPNKSKMSNPYTMLMNFIKKINLHLLINERKELVKVLFSTLFQFI